MPMPMAMMMKPKASSPPWPITWDRIIYLNNDWDIYVRELFWSWPWQKLINWTVSWHITDFNIDYYSEKIVFTSSFPNNTIYIWDLNTWNYNYIANWTNPSIRSAYWTPIYITWKDYFNWKIVYSTDYWSSVYTSTAQQWKFPYFNWTNLVYVWENENIYVKDLFANWTNWTQITNLEIWWSSLTSLDVTSTTGFYPAIIYNWIFHNIAPSMLTTMVKPEYDVSNWTLVAWLFWYTNCKARFVTKNPWNLTWLKYLDYITCTYNWEIYLKGLASWSGDLNPPNINLWVYWKYWIAIYTWEEA